MTKPASKRLIGHLKPFRYPTSDDWSPNFPRDCVEFRTHLYFNEAGELSMVRICVSGEDDTGMEKDMPCLDNSTDMLRSALNWFSTVPNPVSKEWLISQGFHYW